MLRARDALVAARTELINTSTRIGKERGRQAAQVFEPKLSAKGRGGNSGRDARVVVAFGAFGGNTECCIKDYDERIETLGQPKV